ncbi:MAG: N-acetyltransferase [Rhodothermaceae bacterium]|nr:N-acetyltransferase [Rhodothermaceae bacterium]
MILRLATRADAPGMLAIYGPVVQASYASFAVEPPTVEEIEGQIEQTLAHFPWLVCTEGDQILGYAYAGPHRSRAGYRWATEVSVYVHPEAHRQGIARALYTALFALLAAQGFVNVYAGIALPNEASVALHEALGFQQTAHYRQIGFKTHAWRDTGWWHRRINPLDPDPAPPTSLTKLDAAEMETALAEGTALLRT